MIHRWNIPPFLMGVTVTLDSGNPWQGPCRLIKLSKFLRIFDILLVVCMEVLVWIVRRWSPIAVLWEEAAQETNAEVARHRRQQREDE